MNQEPTPPTPLPAAACATLPVAAGIALEDGLLAQVLQAGGSALRLWAPRDTALVVPAKLTHASHYAAARAALAAAGLPLLVRGSGGDVVLQAPGTINIELALALEADAAKRLGVTGAYGLICAPLVGWLRGHGLDAGTGAVAGAFCDGRFNVTLAGRKLAGTAQRWRAGRGGRQALLAHAVVLDHTDVPAMAGAINRFYALCALPRRCLPASHVTLAAALGPSWDEAARLAALAHAYAGHQPEAAPSAAAPTASV